MCYFFHSSLFSFLCLPHMLIAIFPHRLHGDPDRFIIVVPAQVDCCLVLTPGWQAQVTRTRQHGCSSATSHSRFIVASPSSNNFVLCSTFNFFFFLHRLIVLLLFAQVDYFFFTSCIFIVFLLPHRLIVFISFCCSWLHWQPYFCCTQPYRLFVVFSFHRLIFLTSFLLQCTSHCTEFFLLFLNRWFVFLFAKHCNNVAVSHCTGKFLFFFSFLLIQEQWWHFIVFLFSTVNLCWLLHRVIVGFCFSSGLPPGRSHPGLIVFFFFYTGLSFFFSSFASVLAAQGSPPRRSQLLFSVSLLVFHT